MWDEMRKEIYLESKYNFLTFMASLKLSLLFIILIYNNLIENNLSFI